MRKIALFFLLSIPIIPVVAFGATNTLADIINIFIQLTKSLVIVAVSLVSLAFFWGIAKFIYHADNETERAKGKQFLIWGVVALFALVSVWGIIIIIQRTFIL